MTVAINEQTKAVRIGQDACFLPSSQHQAFRNRDIENAAKVLIAAFCGATEKRRSGKSWQSAMLRIWASRIPGLS